MPVDRGPSTGRQVMYGDVCRYTGGNEKEWNLETMRRATCTSAREYYRYIGRYVAVIVSINSGPCRIAGSRT